MIVVYLLIIAVLYVVLYVVPQVSDIFVETYSAEYGVLQVDDEVQCLFVRGEKVYPAPTSGVVNRVAGAGRLMRTGSHIADTGLTAAYSDMRGIVSYFCDGYEKTFTPENMDTVKRSSIEQLLALEENPVQEMASDQAVAGQALFKIIDNQAWYLICWVDLEHQSRYTEGGTVTVDMRDGGQDDESTQLEMTVTSLTKQDKKLRVILSCNRMYEKMDRYRVKKCAVITANHSGILLETDSIITKDGQQGVYVVDKLGDYNFTPIQILDQEGEVTVVEKNYFYDEDGYSVKTVKNYDEILRPKNETNEVPEETPEA